MDIDLVTPIRNACTEAASSGREVITLKVAQVDSLLNSLRDQEFDILAFEKELVKIKENLDTFTATVNCYEFSQDVPDREWDGDIFEIFVGPKVSEIGRIFGFWDASEQGFYYIDAATDERSYPDDVVYWRYSLPDPHEAFDFGTV